MELNSLSDHDLVRLFLEATGNLSLREAEEASGIDHGTIAKWRRDDWKRIYPSTRRTLIEFLEQHAEAVEGEPATHEAVELFVNYDQIVKYLGGVAPPGQDQAVKRDILEGIRRAITATEPLPRWWHELKERVDRGEL